MPPSHLTLKMATSPTELTIPTVVVMHQIKGGESTHAQLCKTHWLKVVVLNDIPIPFVFTTNCLTPYQVLIIH